MAHIAMLFQKPSPPHQGVLRSWRREAGGHTPPLGAGRAAGGQRTVGDAAGSSIGNVDGVVARLRSHGRLLEAGGVHPPSPSSTPSPTVASVPGPRGPRHPRGSQG